MDTLKWFLGTLLLVTVLVCTAGCHMEKDIVTGEVSIEASALPELHHNSRGGGILALPARLFNRFVDLQGLAKEKKRYGGGYVTQAGVDAANNVGGRVSGTSVTEDRIVHNTITSNDPPNDGWYRRKRR